MECSTCQGGIDGYKCDTCGAESVEHDPDHECGSEHCMPKCAGCGEAQVNCSCAY